MGQAKLKSKSQQAILKSEARCIYCEEPASTIEHMPPRMLFLKRRRPSGLEFAACESCNHGTKGADAVAALFSRISHPTMTASGKVTKVSGFGTRSTGTRRDCLKRRSMRH